MNKVPKVSLALLSAFCSVMARTGEGDVTSHTFFSVRPQFQSSMPEKVSLFRPDRLEMAQNGWGGAFQMVFFGGRSTHPENLARFFFPFNKTSLDVVEGDESIAPNGGFIPRDIDPSHFNIRTVNENFRSKISICPRQSTFGIGLAYRQALSYLEAGCPGFWGEISFPITRVRNELCFRERIINNGGGPLDDPTAGTYGTRPVANMTEAFRQPLFRFGRIDTRCCTLEKWGVADIELKLGYNTINRDCCHANTYVGIIIPTGNRPKARHVFEPIIGHNKHFGFMIGGNIGYELWACDDARLGVEIDTTAKYFLRACERRSFDVIDKSWSRYMAVYANQADAIADPAVITPGINVFTQNVQVTPRFSYDMNTAFVYTNCSWDVELGYNFYARQAEKIELCKFPFSPAFADTTVGFINPARTINHQFQLLNPIRAETNYIPLTRCDLNLDSAGHPAVISHIVYGTLGYEWEDICYPTNIGIGGSYEFSSTNLGLHRWNVWGKFGFAF